MWQHEFCLLPTAKVYEGATATRLFEDDDDDDDEEDDDDGDDGATDADN